MYKRSQCDVCVEGKFYVSDDERGNEIFIPISNFPKKIKCLAMNQANYIFDCFRLDKRNIPKFYMEELEFVNGITTPEENIVVINDRIVKLDSSFQSYLEACYCNNPKKISTLDFLKSILTHEIAHNVFSHKYLDSVYRIFDRGGSGDAYIYVDAVDEALAFFCEDYFCGFTNSLFEEKSEEYSNEVNMNILKHFYLAFHSLARQGRLDLVFDKLDGFVCAERVNVKKRTLEEMFA